MSMSSQNNGQAKAISLTLGDITVRWLHDSTFSLDGGAMFGVVPKVLWTKKYPVDSENFIPSCNRPLLITTPRANILIETGLGNKLSDKQKTIYRVGDYWQLPGSLAELGMTREDIDYVVFTHMDFDHASGATMLDGDGKIVPTFPKARYIMQADEWTDVRKPNIRSIHTYWSENWQAIEEAGLAEPVEGNTTLIPGIELIATGGHTRGHQIVKISSGGQTALHMGDLLPLHSHLNPLWVMAYDNFPLESIQQKKKWLTRAAEEGWWLTFYHDPFILAGVWDEEGQLKAQVTPNKADKSE